MQKRFSILYLAAPFLVSAFQLVHVPVSAVDHVNVFPVLPDESVLLFARDLLYKLGRSGFVCENIFVTRSGGLCMKNLVKKIC